jgi:hypothetical protein
MKGSFQAGRFNAAGLFESKALLDFSVLNLYIHPMIFAANHNQTALAAASGGAFAYGSFYWFR